MRGSVHKHTCSGRYQVGLTHSVMEYSLTTVPGQGTAWCSPQGAGEVSLLIPTPSVRDCSQTYLVGLTHSVTEYSLTTVPGQGTAWCSPQGADEVSHFWFLVWGSVHKCNWSGRYQVGLTHYMKEHSLTTVPGQGTAWCSPQGIGRISSLWQSPDPSPESRWMSTSRKHWNSKVTWCFTPSQPRQLCTETEQAGFNFSNKHEHVSSHLVFWEPMKSAVRSYTRLSQIITNTYYEAVLLWQLFLTLCLIILVSTHMWIPSISHCYLKQSYFITIDFSHLYSMNSKA